MMNQNRSCSKSIHKNSTSHNLLPASGCVWQKCQQDCFWTHGILVGHLAALTWACPPTFWGLTVLWDILPTSLCLPSSLLHLRSDLHWGLMAPSFTRCLPEHISSISNPVLLAFIILADTDTAAFAHVCRISQCCALDEVFSVFLD